MKTAVVRNWGKIAGELVNGKPHTTISKVQWILGRINLVNVRVLVNKAILKRIKRTEDQSQQRTLGTQLNDYEKMTEKVKQK